MVIFLLGRGEKKINFFTSPESGQANKQFPKVNLWSWKVYVTYLNSVLRYMYKQNDILMNPVLIPTWSNAVNMVTEFGISTSNISTVFILHKLLKSIPAKHFILLVVSLVLFYRNYRKQELFPFKQTNKI